MAHQKLQAAVSSRNTGVIRPDDYCSVLPKYTAWYDRHVNRSDNIFFLHSVLNQDAPKQRQRGFGKNSNQPLHQFSSSVAASSKVLSDLLPINFTNGNTNCGRNPVSPAQQNIAHNSNKRESSALNVPIRQLYVNYMCLRLTKKWAPVCQL